MSPEPTYEELKHPYTNFRLAAEHSPEPTYEELKLIDADPGLMIGFQSRAYL